MVNCTFSDNIREKEWNAKFNRYKYMGRLGRYNTYDFYAEKGEFKLDTFKHNKFKGNLKTLISKGKHMKRRKRLKFGLPLEVNRVSKVIGVYKRIVKQSHHFKDKKGRVDTLASNTIGVMHSEYFKHKSNKRIKVFSGADKYIMQNLEQCAKLPGRTFSCSDLLDGIFSRTGIDLYLPSLPVFNPEVVLGVTVNPKGNPGLISEQIVAKRRKESTTYSKPVAYKYLLDIMSNKEYTLDTSLWKLGGREKRISISSLSNSPKKQVRSRAIFQPEDIPTLINQSLSKLLMVPLQTLNRGFNYAGRVNGRKNFVKLIDNLKPDSWDIINFNGDYSGHDSHVVEESIVVAFSLLRLCFPEGDAVDKVMYYSMSSMIFTRVVLPNSNLIYELRKGVPSGHGLTAIITTICAFANISTALNKSISRRLSIGEGIHDNLVKNFELSKTYLTNAGDDIMGKVNYKDVSSLSDIITKESGMVVDDLEDNSGYLTSYNQGTRITFLKKKFGLYEISWNNFELYTNLIYPTMMGDNIKEMQANLVQAIVAAPYDDQLNYVIKVMLISSIYNHFLKDKSIHKKNFCGKFSNMEVDKYMVNFVKTLIKDQYYGHYNGIDERILNYKFTSGTMYVPREDRYLNYDIGSYIRDVLRSLNVRIELKWKLLLLFKPFNKWVSVHRLPEFDTKKVFIKPIHTMI